MVNITKSFNMLREMAVTVKSNINKWEYIKRVFDNIVHDATSAMSSF